MKGVLCFAKLAVTNPGETAFTLLLPSGELLEKVSCESWWTRTLCLCNENETVHSFRTSYLLNKFLQKGVHQSKAALQA